MPRLEIPSWVGKLRAKLGSQANLLVKMLNDIFVQVGRYSVRSPVVNNTLNPTWNFYCEFPILEGGNVTIWMALFKFLRVNIYFRIR